MTDTIECKVCHLRLPRDMFNRYYHINRVRKCTCCLNAERRKVYQEDVAKRIHVLSARLLKNLGFPRRSIDLKKTRELLLRCNMTSELSGEKEDLRIYPRSLEKPPEELQDFIVLSARKEGKDWLSGLKLPTDRSNV